MDIDFPLFDNDHLLGDCAMRPIAPRLTRQAVLLRHVGISLLRCPPCRARLSRSLSPFALSLARRCQWSRSAHPCLARQSRHTQAHSTAVSRMIRECR